MEAALIPGSLQAPALNNQEPWEGKDTRLGLCRHVPAAGVGDCYLEIKGGVTWVGRSFSVKLRV